jgi:hypothetical protein
MVVKFFGWDGCLYDCDFNEVLGSTLNNKDVPDRPRSAAPAALLLPGFRKYRRDDFYARYRQGNQSRPNSHAPILPAAHTETER